MKKINFSSIGIKFGITHFLLLVCVAILAVTGYRNAVGGASAWVYYGVSGAALLLVVVSWLGFMRSMIRPLKLLAETAQGMAAGEVGAVGEALQQLTQKNLGEVGDLVLDQVQVGSADLEEISKGVSLMIGQALFQVADSQVGPSMPDGPTIR